MDASVPKTAAAVNDDLAWLQEQVDELKHRIHNLRLDLGDAEGDLYKLETELEGQLELSV
jgi:hypothetical protein